MPVRVAVTGEIAEELRGVHWFKFGVSETITEDQLDHARLIADAVYCDVVGRVDWNRIRIEATSRCLAHEHKVSTYSMPCGSCLRDALLATERHIDWDDPTSVPEPTPPPDVDDWPAQIPTVLGYRRPVTKKPPSLGMKP